jgi:hypothetical protein
MRYIAVWCEYDFNSGLFSSNEGVFKVDPTLADEEVDKLLLDVLVKKTGMSEEDLEDMYSFETLGLDTI